MRRSILLSLILFPAAHAAPVFIGTDTGGNSRSKGIYVADFEDASGQLSEPTLAAETGNPGFLALHPTHPILYAVGRPRTPHPQRHGAVTAFRIEGKTLSFLAETSSGGLGPCHLTLDATGRTLAIANYSDGTSVTLRLDAGGLFERTASVRQHPGSGPNEERQKGPHAHGVYFGKTNRHLFVPDLGIDKVLVYPFDADTSAITDPAADGPAHLSTKPGAGPRHLCFSPDDRHAYVINELDQTILAAGYDAATGALKPLQTIATLPESFTGENTTSEIEVHPNGRFVYGSNRGHNSIVAYTRDPETGTLTLLQHTPCGKTPRHFKISPSGRWLLSAHQDDDTITVFPIDPEDGTLGKPVCTVASPTPICLLFPR